ncbi:protein S40-6-like [Curcuma longa]|uniref:protein S40-6-like n=1 Tax=Curcuma longa TaxID=136217 RepID=UPI003D9E6571
MANNDEDFEEEEVWATLVDGINQPSPYQPTSRAASSHGSPSSAARVIPCGRRVSQSTSPVSIPDRSKIFEHVQLGTHGQELGGGRNDNVDDDDDDDDEDEGEDEDDDKAPPHEWLAKKMARTHISSSVCEGSGRTLKGRDLSKVRNAVLTKTGFLEEDN